MPTIDELMEGKAPGSIKVSPKYRAGWFSPFFLDENKNWHGLNQNGRSEILPSYLDCDLYQDPKPTIKVYEWMYEFAGQWMIREKLMSEEDAALDFNERPYKKTGREFIVEVEA